MLPKRIPKLSIQAFDSGATDSKWGLKDKEKGQALGKSGSRKYISRMRVPATYGVIVSSVYIQNLESSYPFWVPVNIL